MVTILLSTTLPGVFCSHSSDVLRSDRAIGDPEFASSSILYSATTKTLQTQVIEVVHFLYKYLLTSLDPHSHFCFYPSFRF